jgi:hypothetical protein
MANDAKPPGYIKANEVRKRRVEEAIDLIKGAGFMSAGWTEDRVVGTNPDGSPIITPGRKRFCKPHADLYATVGINLVYFYRREDGETIGLASFQTARLDDLKKYLQTGRTPRKPSPRDQPKLRT